MKPSVYGGDTIGDLLYNKVKAFAKAPAKGPVKAPAKAPEKGPTTPKTPAKAPLKLSPKPSLTPAASPDLSSEPSSSAAAACPLRPNKRIVEDFVELESWVGFDERRGRGYTVIVLGEAVTFNPLAEVTADSRNYSDLLRQRVFCYAYLVQAFPFPLHISLFLRQ